MTARPTRKTTFDRRSRCDRAARVASLVLLGCRTASSPSEPPVAEPVAPPSEPTVPTRAEHSVSESVGPPTLAPVAMAATLADTPFAKDAIVVALPAEFAPITLFADEREVLRETIARVIEGAGHPVVPPALLARVDAAAARGVLELEGGRTCRAALTPEEVEHRYFGDRRIARTQVSCFHGCRIDVVVATGDDAIGLHWARTGVRKPEDPRSWIAGARKLRAGGDTHGSGIGKLMGSGPEIEFSSPEGIGPWKRAPAEAAFAEAEPALAACRSPRIANLRFTDVRASVTPTGAIDRCEASSPVPHALIGPDLGACICDVVRNVRFDRGAAGRRLRVDVVQRSMRVSSREVSLTALQTGTDDWLERLRRSGVADACFEQSRPDASTRLTIGLPLAEDGSIGEVRIVGEIATQSNARFATCLVAELPSVELPCRPPGLTELRVQMDVRVAGH